MHLGMNPAEISPSETSNLTFTKFGVSMCSVPSPCMVIRYVLEANSEKAAKYQLCGFFGNSYIFLILVEVTGLEPVTPCL